MYTSLSYSMAIKKGPLMSTSF